MNNIEQTNNDLLSQVMEKHGIPQEQDLMYCEICSKLLWNNDDIDEDYHYIDETIIACCDCFHDKYFECDECQETFEKDEIHEHKEYWFCENCYNVYIKEDNENEL